MVSARAAACIHSRVRPRSRGTAVTLMALRRHISRCPSRSHRRRSMCSPACSFGSIVQSGVQPSPRSSLPSSQLPCPRLCRHHRWSCGSCSSGGTGASPARLPLAGARTAVAVHRVAVVAALVQEQDAVATLGNALGAREGAVITFWILQLSQPSVGSVLASSQVQHA